MRVTLGYVGESRILLGRRLRMTVWLPAAMACAGKPDVDQAGDQHRDGRPGWPAAAATRSNRQRVEYTRFVTAWLRVSRSESWCIPVADRAGCRAAVSAAGNQLIGASLHLGRPMLLLPEQAHVEQSITSSFLVAMGAGEFCHLEAMSPRGGGERGEGAGTSSGGWTDIPPRPTPIADGWTALRPCSTSSPRAWPRPPAD